LVAEVALLSTQEPHQQELQQAVLVELVIYIQVAQAQVGQLIPAEQVAVAVAISLLAVTHQVMMAVLAVTVVVAVAVLTTQAHQVRVATAYFIFTTKEN
jgi:hypothetical protein